MKTRQSNPFWLALLLLASALLGPVSTGRAVVINNEYWVWTNASTANLGTLLEPYDGSTQVKFDAVMNAMPPNSTIHILAGHYETAGYNQSASGGWSVQTGQHILGSGMNITVLHLTNGSPVHYGVIESRIVGVTLLPASNVMVMDLTVDLGGSTNQDVGIGLAGTDITVQRVRVANMLDDVGQERFPIVLSNYNFPTVAKVTVSDCEVTNCHFANGCSAIAVGGGGGAYVTSPTICNNRIYLEGNFLKSQFGINIVQSDNVLVTGNRIYGAQVSLYSDSGPSTNMVVTDNVFENCWIGVALHNSPQSNLLFARNTIKLGYFGGWVGGFTFGDDHAGIYTNVLIMNNTISLYGAFYGLLSGVTAVNTVGLTLVNNSWDSGTTFNLVGSTGINAYNNTDLFGSPLLSLNQIKPPNSVTRRSVAGATYTAVYSDKYIGVQNGAGATITLPSASSHPGKEFVVAKEVSAGTVTLNSAGGTINGVSSYTFSGGFAGQTVVSDGSNWYAH